MLPFLALLASVVHAEEPADAPALEIPYEQYALDAFDIHAVDYVLKPFDEKRLQVAVDKARHRYTAESLLHEQSKASVIGAIDTIGQQSSEGSAIENGDQLIVRDSGTVHFVDQERIDWIDAAGDYMCVHADNVTHIMRITMKQLEEMLNPLKFLRIHRSTIVNADRINSAQSLTNGEFLLSLEGGAKLKVSRSYRDKIRELTAAR